MSSFPPSHFAFLALPPELKCKILNHIGHRSILQLSMTSKEMYHFIYSSTDLGLKIELGRSQLVSTAPVQSTVTARQLLDGHRESRLTLPVAARPFVRFTSPTGPSLGPQTAQTVRLFRGFFASLSDDLTLRVWDLRKLDSTQSPEPFLTISHRQYVQDVLIEPELDLLVLICYEFGSNYVFIKFLELSSLGTRPYPRAAQPMIVLPIPPNELFQNTTEGEIVSLRSNLLALVYEPHFHSKVRRGIIWDWTTGHLVYDSNKTQNPGGFRHLLLSPLPGCFIVSTLTPEGLPPCRSGCIELRIAVTASRSPGDSPPPSELVGIFHLPQLAISTNGSVEELDFFSSVPNGSSTSNSGDTFPFDSNPETSVQVLFLSYDRSVCQNSGENEAYLVISNQVFVDVLRRWLSWKGRMQQSENDRTFPLNLDWFAWAPWWTCMWGFQDVQGEIKMSSSVCGTRVCTTQNFGENLIVIKVFDFNMNFPCNARNCTKPLAHFYPRSVDIADWQDKIYTWLPFHVDLRFIEFPADEAGALVLMDEERIFLCDMRTPASWTVVYMLQEPQGARDQLDRRNYLKAVHVPRREWQPSTFRLDRTCRLCAEEPHTNAHILLECKANSDVVKLRQTLLIDNLEGSEPDLYRLWCSQLYEVLFKNLMDRRDKIQMLVSLLATNIRTIYKGLPQCDPATSAPSDNYSYMFAVKR